MRVLIAVTHLLGAGHLTRSAALARAFAARGHATTLISGGMPAPHIALDGVTCVQLAPVRIEGTAFSILLDADGAAVDAAYLAARKATLEAALAESDPDLVVTELFPFGRRVLADEFLALVTSARARPRRPAIACSVRDILVAPARQGRIDETHARLLALYDRVLVHGDPAVAPLDASWPIAESIRPLLSYTGYVDEGAPPPPAAARDGILVSGGSSAASLPLYKAAVEAARIVDERRWHILVGRGIAQDAFEAIRAAAPAHAAVERARSDFRDCLARSALSVSQAGYNTAVDLLRADVPAVLVPFERGNETEQRLRAERMSALGRAVLLPEADLTPDALAACVRTAIRAPVLPALAVALDGAQVSVELAETMTMAKPALHARASWAPAIEALARCADFGHRTAFWWRDDDASADTHALQRLLALARRHGAGLAVAAIPARLQPSLGEALAQDGVFALVHGLSHDNHAPAGEKKAEFGAHRPIDALAADAARALSASRHVLGARLLPVFVPPWNRIAPAAVERLAGAGFTGLSTFQDRADATIAGLAQVNTHIDPIDWHGGRSVVDEESLVARLVAAIDRRAGLRSPEPIGLLTHHLVHDEAVWTLCERLLDLLSRNNVVPLHPDRVFAEEAGSRGEDVAL